ncbi:hypothetical protein [Streptomyces sp. NPDC090080]|uniref:hypothetical protein n=1 Tax=Streptomyces sp. NPDC090080 TaxID=3365939 RepID=UPI0038041FC9
MGQTPAQKAAKAARGQQPKKRPGNAQREASLRAQAAKKAGGGKPAAKRAAAKKTVPLPRGSVRAAFPGINPACFLDYGKGEVITKVTDGWGQLRTPAAVGSRAGVRPQQGPDRQRRDVPRPEALGLAARCLAVQHPPRPLNRQPGVWRRPRTSPAVKGWSRVKTDTAGRSERSADKG